MNVPRSPRVRRSKPAGRVGWQRPKGADWTAPSGRRPQAVFDGEGVIEGDHQRAHHRLTARTRLSAAGPGSPPRAPRGSSQPATAPANARPARRADGGDEPVAERLRRAVAAGGGEHGDEDRHAEGPAQLAHRRERARRLADVGHGDAADDRLGHGRQRHREADAGHGDRRHQFRVGHVRPGDQRDPRQPDRLQDQPAGDQRALADAVDQRPGARADEERRDAPREHAEPRHERPVAEADLHELQLAAWRGLDGFGGRSSLRTWLYRIATNRCLNALRDSARRPQTEPIRTVEPTWLEPYPDVLLDDLPDVAPGPEGALRRSAAERELVGHYAEAFEQGDVDRLVALLSEDALMTMPPQPIEVHGPAAIADFLLAREWWGAGRARLVATRANGQPACALYLRDPHAPIARAHSIVVLTLDGDRIAHITRFGDLSLLARFGLPRIMS